MVLVTDTLLNKSEPGTRAKTRNMRRLVKLLWLPILVCPVAASFFAAVVPSQRRETRHSRPRVAPSGRLHQQSSTGGTTVQLDPTLTEEKITALFAWISRAFDGDDDRYNNLMLAVAAVFGNLPPTSPPSILLRDALQSLSKDENTLTGEPFSMNEREMASMGAMGASQWTGQWRTRPHALLTLRQSSQTPTATKGNINNSHNTTSAAVVYVTVQDWERTLPRGCRRTLKRALEQNFTIRALPIRNNKPAPHSSLAHFRCVVEHEVRLLTASSSSPLSYFDINDFLDALAEAVSRYMGTTRMTGEIREYRDADTGKVIAFAHEVRKGRTIRGQWFYATDEAAKRYVWFHSVYSLVQRAIESNNCTGTNGSNSSVKHVIDAVDLGPSGSDDFSDLKARYGFVSVEDWPAVANYQGPFWDYETNAPAKNGVTW